MTIEERNELVVQNMNLVHYIAHRLHISPYAYFSYEDLVQEGMIGLILSVERFNPKLGFKFSTYASMTIKGTILRFLRENQHQMKYSRLDIDALVKINKLGKSVFELTQSEISDLDIDPKRLAAVMAMQSTTSLDTPINPKDEANSNSTALDLIADPNTSELSEEFYAEEFDQLKDLAKPKRYNATSNDIIDEWYYSRQIGVSVNQKYLADKYKLSQPQISRIIRKFKSDYAKVLEDAGYSVEIYTQD